VEAVGIEPTSEDITRETSTSVALHFSRFAALGRRKAGYREPLAGYGLARFAPANAASQPARRRPSGDRRHFAGGRAAYLGSEC
jgi:hypothetical protein